MLVTFFNHPVLMQKVMLTPGMLWCWMFCSRVMRTISVHIHHIVFYVRRVSTLKLKFKGPLGKELQVPKWSVLPVG